MLTSSTPHLDVSMSLTPRMAAVKMVNLSHKRRFTTSACPISTKTVSPSVSQRMTSNLSVSTLMTLPANKNSLLIKCACVLLGLRMVFAPRKNSKVASSTSLTPHFPRDVWICRTVITTCIRLVALLRVSFTISHPHSLSRSHSTARFIWITPLSSPLDTSTEMSWTRLKL